MEIVYRIRDKGKTVGYVIRDNTLNFQGEVSVADARMYKTVIKNAYLSGDYYVRKNGYPEIPDIELSELHRKKKRKKNKGSNKKARRHNSVAAGTNKPVKADNKNTEIVNANELEKADIKSEENKSEDSGIWEDIDFLGKEYLKICKTVRMAAKQGRLEFKPDPHFVNGGLNVQLYEIVEQCGYSTVNEYVTEYLKFIQPFSLAPYQETKAKAIAGHRWVLELGYRVSIVIKIDLSNKEKPVIISFHENNRGGKMNTIPNRVFNRNDLCAVITDSASKCEGGYIVRFKTMHGFIKTDYTEITRHYNKNTALVPYGIIKDRYDEYVRNKYIEILRNNSQFVSGDSNTKDTIIVNTEKGRRAFDYPSGSIEQLDSNRFSIVSFGKYTVNNICFLIDAYAVERDGVKRNLISGLAYTMFDLLPESERERVNKGLDSRAIIKENGLYKTIKKWKW